MSHRIAHFIITCSVLAMQVASTGCSSLGQTATDETSQRGRVLEEQVISRPRDGSRNSEPDERSSRQENGASPDDSSSLYTISAEAFFDGGRARRSLDLDNVNQELLAAAVFT